VPGQHQHFSQIIIQKVIRDQAASQTMTAVAESFISIAWGVLSSYFSVPPILCQLSSSRLSETDPCWSHNSTSLWRFLDAFYGRTDKTQLALPRKFDSAVQIGPNDISLSDPSLNNKAYTTTGAWKEVSISLPLQVHWLTHIY
jgi:hypothetical protein